MKKRRVILGAFLLMALSITACEMRFDFGGVSFDSGNNPSSLTDSSDFTDLDTSSSENHNQPSSSSSIISSNSSSASSQSSPSSASSHNSSASSSSSSSSSVVTPEIVSFEIFAFNDTHGNVKDTQDKGIGIAKTTTALKELSADKNTIFISQGDMWQGSVESNYTHGNLVTEWMNSLNFVSMTVGNHEYDWGKEAIIQNTELADFPTLGINVLNTSNSQRVDYLDASTTFTRAGVKFGVIGAIGNCLSSISGSKVQGVRFATGNELTNLVKAESTRLRNEEHCDFIIYSLHGSGSRDEADSYNITLSSDHYVDLVLEGHTHTGYAETDSEGIYHIQSNAYNRSIYKITLDYDLVNKTFEVDPVSLDMSYATSPYKDYVEDSDINALFTKYYDQYSFAYAEIGHISERKDADTLRYKIADLYLEKGLEKWGDDYPNIMLGGGYMSCRGSHLEGGVVTYSDLINLFPFDNDVVLVSISGSDFKKTQYYGTIPDTYFIAWSSYGNSVKNNIDNNETYYLVMDTYGSDHYLEVGKTYSCQSMVIIDALEVGGTYARDLLADYIAAGNWDDTPTEHDGTILDPKTIAEARSYALDHPGANAGVSESEGFFYTGVVAQLGSEISTSTGDMKNLYVKDASLDNKMLVYYIKRFESATKENNWQTVDDLKVGDVLVFWGKAFYYNSTTIEFAAGAYVYSINGVLTAPEA